MGELQHYRCEDLKIAIGTEYGLSQIKLLILSSQNKKVMKTIFHNIGIQNIIYIEKKITYPEPNEQEVNFIKELYKNILIERLSIQEAFNKSKGKVNDKSTVEIYPSTKNRNDYIIPQKNNSNINNNEDIVQKFYSQKNLLLKENHKNNLKLNRNCSLNLDFVKYNYKVVIGRNIELKNCIDKLYRYNNVCVCGYPGAGKKSFIQLVGKFAFERNMYEEIHYIEIYYLRNADEILINKKNQIKDKMKVYEENQLEL